MVSFRKYFVSTILLLMTISVLKAQASVPEINIHYLGHSSFVLSFDNGINIVTDYGKENAWLEWGWDSPIHSIGELVPQVMTYSHKHDDHYDRSRIPNGVEKLLSDTDNLSIMGIEIIPIRTCEDNIDVESNTSFIFKYKGLKICHLGDAQAQIMNINETEVRDKILSIFPDQFDLLFMTIEGQEKFIPQAEEFIRLLNPKKVIHMHYWSNEYLDEFISYIDKANAKKNIYKITQNKGTAYLLTTEKNQGIEIIILERSPFLGHK